MVEENANIKRVKNKVKLNDYDKIIYKIYSHLVI